MIKLGLPSKGRLQQQCVDWFATRGLEIERTESGREYAGRIRGADGVELVLLSASEIPRELAAGRIDIGVTGEDVIREKIPGWRQKIRLAAKLGFGQADLIVAVPSVWVDVDTLHDLDAAAAAFRKRHGMRMRIATKYHNLSRAFLQDAGVADYQLIDSQGATEATPLNMTAEAIIDITSTGETLGANHLKILSDGLILKSEANLCVSLVSKAPMDEIDAFLAKLT